MTHVIEDLNSEWTVKLFNKKELQQTKRLSCETEEVIKKEWWNL